MQESYIETVKHNDEEIGEIWLESDGYSAKPYFGDIGHAGFDTLEEARSDVNEMYEDHLCDRQRRLKKILVEFSDEIMLKPKS